MDSSINTAKPYKEKGPPRRKAPVRKPRAPKATVTGPIVTSLIPQSERIAIRMAQAKIVAQAKEAGASTLQRAIRSNLARKAVKTMRASMSKPKNEIVSKMKAPKNEIVAKVTAPKKEPKARVPRTPKPVYKMSYAAALKEWNMSHNTGMYCNPRKGSTEYNAVQALRL